MDKLVSKTKSDPSISGGNTNPMLTAKSSFLESLSVPIRLTVS